MKMMGGKFRAAVLMAGAVSVLAFAAGAKAQDRKSNDNDSQHDDAWHFGNSAPNDNPWPYNKGPRSPVLAVVGDIACQPETEATGEASKEVCTDPKTPTTAPTIPHAATILCGNPRSTPRIRLRL